jgi:hypothetical protein
MHVWRDIGPELSVGLSLVAWVVTLLVTPSFEIRAWWSRVPRSVQQVREIV